jgi:hypothetical protein
VLRDSSLGKSGQASCRSSVSRRRLWRAHNSAITGSQDDRADPGYRNRGIAAARFERARQRKHSRRAESPILGSGCKQSRDVASPYCCSDEPARGPSACSTAWPGASEQTHHPRVGAGAPPRQAPTRLRVAGLDGQRLVDRRVDATVRRRDRHDRCSAQAELVRLTPGFAGAKKNSPAELAGHCMGGHARAAISRILTRRDGPTRRSTSIAKSELSG